MSIFFASFQKLSTRILLFLVAAFFASNASAQEGTFSDFQVGIVGLKTRSGASDPLSLDFHWSPSLTYQDLAVRGDVGLAILNTSGANSFAMFSYQVFIEGVVANNLWANFGGGYQTWLEQGGLSPVLSTNLFLVMPKESRLVKRVYVGLSRLFSDDPSWQWRAGVGFTI